MRKVYYKQGHPLSYIDSDGCMVSASRDEREAVFSSLAIPLEEQRAAIIVAELVETNFCAASGNPNLMVSIVDEYVEKHPDLAAVDPWFEDTEKILPLLRSACH